ncbi:MAG TPA: ABC transporter permease [Vicinamibacterales bacterium]|nr:ABC transporter permease [Vicinamibacterales bacterium]
MRRIFQFRWRSPTHIREDVDAEVRFHLDARVEELIAGGLPRAAALAEARREFGDLEDARQYMHRIDRRTEWQRRRRNYMWDFQRDVQYAIRRLRSSPGFTAAAILTLALGIGANTAIFSIVNSVLFRPLPFPEPERLYAVYSANRTADLLQAPVSAVDLDDWRAQRQQIEDIGGYFYAEGSTGIDLTGRGDPRRLSVVFFTPGFFSSLRVTPSQGRLPHENEMVRGGRDRVVLLSHRFWTNEFGASAGVAGTTVMLGGSPHDVLGVLPAEMRFPTDLADVFVPYSTIPDSGIPRIRPVRTLSVVARAKPGISREAVQAEMNTIASRLAGQYPEDRAWDAATVLPLHEVVTSAVRRPLLVLLGAVGFVVLLACVNLAGLQLARAVGRGREIGVRIALGARRGRLVRQLLTESLVLSVCGGVVGVFLAILLTPALLALAAGELPRASEVRLDAFVLTFSLLLSVLTGLLFGLVPAWRTASWNVHQMLREGGRGNVAAESGRLRTGLIVAEVALAVILVAGAALMGRSFVALLDVDPGFRATGLIAVQFTINTSKYPPPPAPPAGSPASARVPAPYTRFYTQVIEQVRTLPGVVSAAAVKDPPFRGNGERNGFGIPGRPVPAGQDAPSAATIHVSDGYFRTIGARIVDGREFTPQDRFDAPFVVVVNEAFARQFFPGERAVGHRILRGAPVEIVGVVNDIRQVALAEPARPTMYVHNLQNSRVKTTIVARAQGDPLALAGAIREAIWSIDPQQSITGIFTFDESVSRALARPRLVTVLLLSFGGVGLLLGAVGIYGILAFLVQQRRSEIGVRLALGARPVDVAASFVRRGLVLTVAGVAIGLAGALLLSRYLEAVLYGVRPTDPATFAGVAVMLLVAAALASWLPARRAARVDPAATLR